jgi:predicted Zn-dependent protease
MKKILTLSLIMLFWACGTVPITGRRQLNLINGNELQALSLTQYQQTLRQSQVVSGTTQSEMIKRVGNRIADATEKYLQGKNQGELVQGFNWEFNLIKDNSINAWCMPGGKVAFYTGILPICATEEGVAVVMGHEIAHAIARHGAERMSQGLVQQAGGVALSVALRDKPAQTQQLFNTAYGIGSTLAGTLPFSRLHESEADELGLMFMAKAGYNPKEAPKFWQRMKQATGGSQTPEFLSTHPNHDKRIKNLNNKMGKAYTAFLKQQGKL